MKSFFLLTSSDRRAMIVIAVLAVLCLGGVILFGSAPKEEDSKVQKFKGSREAPAVRSTAESQELREGGFCFDPNTVDSATLVALGLSPKQTHVFLNYRRAGAVFRKPEDISRCYAISEREYEILQPCIRIATARRSTVNSQRSTAFHADVAERHQRSTASSRIYARTSDTHGQRATHKSSVQCPESRERFKSNKFSELTLVDVNRADTAMLKRIPGVGDGIAGMIIRLRERFGGFTSVEQLREIEVMTPELMEWFKVADDFEPRRININIASFKTLVTHPYISAEQTKGILNYIRVYGRIESLDALLGTGIFSREEVERLEPYLEF